MKNLLYTIIGLLVLIWIIVSLNYNTSGLVHLVFAIAILVALIWIALKKQVINKQ